MLASLKPTLGRTFLQSFWAMSLVGCVLSSAWAPRAKASELYELYRGARAMGMGGAYIGLADDEMAVFMNPAGLGGNKTSGLHLAILDTTVSTDTIYSAKDVMSVFSNPSLSGFNALMGKDVAARVQFTPTLIMGNLGVSILIDQQVALMAENQALPQMAYAYQTTNGVQVAYGYELSRKRMRRLKVRLGVAGKLMFRRGGYSLLPTSALLNPSPQTLFDRIGGYGKGYGVDVGTQVIGDLTKELKLSAAFVTTDLGDTSFGSGPQAIAMNMSVGFALQYQLRNAGKLSMLWDFRHLNEEDDWRKKSHFGMELALPLFSLYGGFNQTYVSYGAAFDLYLFRITAASYAEETGALAFQDGQRRYQLRVDVKFGL